MWNVVNGNVQKRPKSCGIFWLSVAYEPIHKKVRLSCKLRYRQLLLINPREIPLALSCSEFADLSFSLSRFSFLFGAASNNNNNT